MSPPERIVCLTEETVETLYLPLLHDADRGGAQRGNWKMLAGSSRKSRWRRSRSIIAAT
jgi:hypothetical protein